jgi:hypothetical protein
MQQQYLQNRLRGPVVRSELPGRVFFCLAQARDLVLLAWR